MDLGFRVSEGAFPFNSTYDAITREGHWNLVSRLIG